MNSPNHVSMTAPEAEREKSLAAFSSVLAALLLTGLKLVVGLATNSLGLLSEAAHSGFDLIAAVVTWFAVRLGSRPPDARHPYGHGKVENLSALIETGLLLVTCVFIIREAVLRLVSPEPVEVTVWSLGVLLVSIAVDVGRSRLLFRMAEKHSSQALEADAVHFASDVWSSLAVLVGLGAAALGDHLPEGSAFKPFLARADAVAALAVAAIVVKVSLELGRKAVDVLLDGGSGETLEAIERTVRELPGVREVRRIRMRHGGPTAFVDMSLEIRRSASFEEASLILAEAERAARDVAPGADVVVHMVPGRDQESSLAERIRAMAALEGVDVHDVHLHHARDHRRLELHVETPHGLTLAEAHARASALERAIVRDLERESPGTAVVTHIEPSCAGEVCQDCPPGEAEAVRAAVRELAGRRGVHDVHEVAAHRAGGRLMVSFHCRMAPETSMAAAHDMSTDLEHELRIRLPRLGRVLIHMEPRLDSDPDRTAA